MALFPGDPDFTVYPPGLLLTALTPASGTVGGAALPLVVDGTSFPSGAAVQWNGRPLPTTFVAASQLSAAVPAQLLSAPGEVKITVATADGVSNALLFAVEPPAPVISDGGVVNAANGLPAIAPGSLISIYGSHLARENGSAAAMPLPSVLNGASVMIDGSPVPLLYVSSWSDQRAGAV